MPIDYGILKEKNIILDFDGVITTLFVDWEDLRRKLTLLVGTEPKDFGSLYLEAQELGKKKQYLEIKAKDELNGLNHKIKSELFSYLESNQIPYDIFSSNTEAVINKFLELNKARSVKKVIANDHVSFIKPHPEGIFSLTGGLDESFILIGDSGYDELAAKAAKINFIKYNVEQK